MIRALLTIDDISSRNTPALVDYLNEKSIPAVMFAVGMNVERYPEQAIYALKNGMVIGNHSYSHPRFSDLSPDTSIREIQKCEDVLDRLYETAGVERVKKVFRFPYGDKGGENKMLLQQYLKEHQFSKVRDTEIPFPWWKENGLHLDIDTYWSFDFAEYNIRPGSSFTRESVLKRIFDQNPAQGGALLTENTFNILLLHAHDETEAMVPQYYRQFLDILLENGVTFVKPSYL